MNLKRIILLFGFALISTFLYAHSGKARYHIIVNTDGSADDLPALCMFLASPDFEIIAISCQNTENQQNTLWKVRALLSDLGHEGITTGHLHPEADKDITPKTVNLSWGTSMHDDILQKASGANWIIEEINKEEEPVFLIDLGCENAFSFVEKNPKAIPQVEALILLSGNKTDDPKKSPLNKLFLSPGTANINHLLSQFTASHSPYIKTILKNKALLSNKKSEACEQAAIIPLYMMDSTLFIRESKDLQTSYHTIPDNIQGLQTILISFFNSNADKENKVFQAFPKNENAFADDVRPLCREIIRAHGELEWRTGVLTNEIHGHLGIYAIIGNKMGIRARQYFNVGVDDIQVVSFAGLKPPISCMNDGIQVASGSTLGHGLISISDDHLYPEALFEFKSKKLRISLKQEYFKQIRTDVKDAIAKHGNLTPDYWKRIRELAIRYWLEMDRMEIFDMIIEQ